MNKMEEIVVVKAARALHEHIPAIGGMTTEELMSAVENALGTLERAPHWKEVFYPYAWKEGEPYRVEKLTGEGVEGRVDDPAAFEWLPDTRAFTDTRWSSVRDKFRVGDVIENWSDLIRLFRFGDGVVLTDYWGNACIVLSEENGITCQDNTFLMGEDAMRRVPYTVVYAGDNV